MVDIKQKRVQLLLLATNCDVNHTLEHADQPTPISFCHAYIVDLLYTLDAAALAKCASDSRQAFRCTHTRAQTNLDGEMYKIKTKVGRAAYGLLFMR